MPDFSPPQEQRIQRLLKVFYSIARKENIAEAVLESEELKEKLSPAEIITLVDKLVRDALPTEELKAGINKFLNLFHEPLKKFPGKKPLPGSYLNAFVLNNQELDVKLKKIRQFIRDINHDPQRTDILHALAENFREIQRFEKHYQIKENVLFPLLEKHWSGFRCLGIMWSFHDDIRRDLNKLTEILSSKSLDLDLFNQLSGNIYFNMYTIRFREENILFPVILESIPEEELERLWEESLEIGFPYIQPQVQPKKNAGESFADPSLLNMGTGQLKLEEIVRVFNHLPVDVTFVDENNKVRYFSTPAHRIFPRTHAVIGRDVRNCHPPESVHVVEKIIEQFREKKQKEANFWIRMKEKFLHIRYFALYDEKGEYRGVLEVTQDITDIQKLEGERRILDW